MQRKKENFKRKIKKTSDTGSQYRCGRVGRGNQPPSTPNTLSNIEIYTISFKTLVFGQRPRKGPMTYAFTQKKFFLLLLLLLLRRPPSKLIF